ncbi:MAG TPA: Xaa-Pro peptidase family protein [Thermomicrobiales bacterium]|nr:Xaa-Pro peptidase family protein [Thermomicrobiales bacterium]
MSNSNENAVIEARLARAREVMSEQGVDFLFVTPSSDLIYMLGYPAHASERMTLLCVPRDGEPFVVVPTLEASRLESRKGIVDIHRWEETESPSELTARLVEGANGATIAISDQTWSIFLLRLRQALPESGFTSGTDVLRQLRMIKDEQEIAYLRHAGSATDKAWNTFVETCTLAGRTERDAADDIRRLLAENGLPSPGFLIVGSGPNSASPHHMTSDRVIQEGDAVVFDFGSTWHHYWSDLTRTVHVGEASDEFRVVYDTVLAANRAARAAVRPGVPCEAIDRAARDVIEAAGYGEYFIHRVGHGLGLDGHEEPYMVSGNTLPLKPGMVFSDEPGIYIPGRFGVRIEDILVCTEDGVESFNDARRDLVVMS